MSPLFESGKHLLDEGSLEFLQRLGFDLTNALACHRQMLPHLFECARLIFSDAKSQSDDSLFSGRQGAEDSIHFTGEFRAIHESVRRDRLMVRQQFSEFRAAVADPMLQSHRFLEGLNGFVQAIGTHAHGEGDFFQPRLTSQLLQEAA